jgi:hypothetical protein
MTMDTYDVAMEVEAARDDSEVRQIRILITGSRTWTNTEKFNDALELIRRQHPDTSRWVIVHGDCPEGADMLADAWARVRGIATDPHPAQWRVDGAYNAAAGFERNTEMVEAGADVCLAFLKPCVKRNCRKGPAIHGSHGTTHCAQEAKDAGIAVWTIEDGFPK